MDPDEYLKVSLLSSVVPQRLCGGTKDVVASEGPGRHRVAEDVVLLAPGAGAAARRPARTPQTPPANLSASSSLSLLCLCLSVPVFSPSLLSSYLPGSQDDLLRRAVGKHGGRNWKQVPHEAHHSQIVCHSDEVLTHWKQIADLVPDKSATQCLHRWQRVLNPTVVKGPWRKEVSLERFSAD